LGKKIKKNTGRDGPKGNKTGDKEGPLKKTEGGIGYNKMVVVKKSGNCSLRAQNKKSVCRCAKKPSLRNDEGGTKDVMKCPKGWGSIKKIFPGMGGVKQRNKRIHLLRFKAPPLEPRSRHQERTHLLRNLRCADSQQQSNKKNVFSSEGPTKGVNVP